MAEAPVGFGGGLGATIGGVLGARDLERGKASVDATTGAALGDIGGIASDFRNSTAPYNTFGQSFLDPATSTIGDARSFANNTQGYNQFMSTYTNTPAAQYQLQQADAVQNNSAAARGGLLSGSNQRALSTINNGIVAQGANTAYNEYLAGNNQQFGQLESALGNMFKAIGVGQTATGQQAQVDVAKMGNQSAMAQAQAKNDQSKGSGIGSMFSGLGSAFAMF